MRVRGGNHRCLLEGDSTLPAFMRVCGGNHRWLFEGASTLLDHPTRLCLYLGYQLTHTTVQTTSLVQQTHVLKEIKQEG